MGQRLIRINEEFMKQFLLLPDDLAIIDCQIDFDHYRGDIILKVEHPSFSEVLPGNQITTVYPTYANLRRDCGCYETRLTSLGEGMFPVPTVGSNK